MENNLILSPIPLDHLMNQLRLLVREEITAAGNGAKQENGSEKFLTRADVAERLNITLVTVDSWTRKGKLKGYRVGRKIRYKSGEVDAALKPINIGK